jgi:hypothetical protein
MSVRDTSDAHPRCGDKPPTTVYGRAVGCVDVLRAEEPAALAGEVAALGQRRMAVAVVFACGLSVFQRIALVESGSRALDGLEAEALEVVVEHVERIRVVYDRGNHPPPNLVSHRWHARTRFHDLGGEHGRVTVRFPCCCEYR